LFPVNLLHYICLRFSFFHKPAKIDPQDRRSVLMQLTTKRAALLREIPGIMDRCVWRSEKRAAKKAAA
jgi:hypothetical protein